MRSASGSPILSIRFLRGPHPPRTEACNYFRGADVHSPTVSLTVSVQSFGALILGGGGVLSSRPLISISRPMPPPLRVARGKGRGVCVTRKSVAYLLRTDHFSHSSTNKHADQHKCGPVQDRDKAICSITWTWKKELPEPFFFEKKGECSGVLYTSGHHFMRGIRIEPHNSQ